MTLSLSPISQGLASTSVDKKQYLVKSLEVVPPDSCIDFYFGRSRDG